MKLFELFATLGLDSREFTKGIGNAKSTAQGFLSSVESVGKSVAGVTATVSAAVGAAVGAFGKVALDGAMQLEATEAKYNTVFAGFTDMADKLVSDFQRLTPATESATRSMASGLQDLLVPMGFAREEATNMTAETMHLIGALTNFNSATETAESVQAKFAGALTGETQGLKSLGIQISQTSLEQYALANGYAKTKDEIDTAVKAQVILAMAYEQSGDALAAYNEESLDTTTRMQLLKAEVTDAAAQIGQSMLPAVNEVLSAVRSLSTEAMPSFSQAAQGFVGMLTGSADAADQFAEGVRGITDVIGSTLPTLLQQGTDIVLTLIDGVSSAMPDFIQSAANIVPSVLDSIETVLPKLLDSGAAIVESISNGISDNAHNIVQGAAAIVKKIAQWFGENAGKLATAAGNLIGSLSGELILYAASFDWVPVAAAIIKGIAMAALHLPASIINSAGDAIVGGLMNSIYGSLEAADWELANEAMYAGMSLDDYKKMKQAGTEAGTAYTDSVVSGVLDSSGNVYATTSDMMRQSRDVMLALGNGYRSVGESISDNTADGVSDNAYKASDATTSAVNDANAAGEQAAQGAERIGQIIINGIALKIEEGADGLKNLVDGIVGTALGASLNRAASAAASAANAASAQLWGAAGKESGATYIAKAVEAVDKGVTSLTSAAKRATGGVSKAAKTAAEDALQTWRKATDKRILYENLTTEQIIAEYRKQLANYKQGSDEHYEISKEIARLEDQLAKDRDAAIKKSYDEEQKALKEREAQNKESLKRLADLTKSYYDREKQYIQDKVDFEKASLAQQWDMYKVLLAKYKGTSFEDDIRVKMRGIALEANNTYNDLIKKAATADILPKIDPEKIRAGFATATEYVQYELDKMTREAELYADRIETLMAMEGVPEQIKTVFAEGGKSMYNELRSYLAMSDAEREAYNAKVMRRIEAEERAEKAKNQAIKSDNATTVADLTRITSEYAAIAPSKGRELITKMADGIKSGGSIVGTTVSTILSSAFAPTVTAALASGAGKSSIDSAAKAVSDNAGTFNTAMEGVSVSGLAAFAAPLTGGEDGLSVGADFIAAAWDSVSKALPDLLTNMTNAGTSAGNAFAQALMAAASSISLGGIGGLMDPREIEKLMESSSIKARAEAATAKGNAEHAKWLNGLIPGPQSYSTINNTLQKSYKNSGIGSTMFSMGVNASMGISAGMVSSGPLGALAGAASSLANGMVSSLQNVLQIHSPSQLLADEVGAPGADGIAQGFVNQVDSVISTMTAAVTDMTAATFDVAMAQGQTIGQYITSGIDSVLSRYALPDFVQNGLAGATFGQLQNRLSASVYDAFGRSGPVSASMIGPIQDTVNAVSSSLIGGSPTATEIRQMGETVARLMGESINYSGPVDYWLEQRVRDEYEAVRKDNQINSPSKKWRNGVGVPIIDGVIQGIESKKLEAERMIASLTSMAEQRKSLESSLIGSAGAAYINNLQSTSYKLENIFQVSGSSDRDIASAVEDAIRWSLNYVA